MDNNRLALTALHFIPGIGNHLIRQLVSYCGSAENVFKTPKGKLKKIPGVGDRTAEAIIEGKPFAAATNELKQAEARDVQLIFYTDKNYPRRLKTLNDAPSVLYTKGRMDLDNPKSVAIVGTRQATDYGRERVEELIHGLVSHQALIVSGLAYGIDIHAHKQAVKNTLPTVGVMGSGIDVIYPAPHKETARKMMDNGGLISENKLGTKPDAHHFPVRNRIIAGLCDVLIVVEAAERGGALITAEIANSYNRDVFAFPGDIGRSHSSGCNNLIKQNKAHLITSVSDLEFIMNWRPNEPAPIKRTTLDLSEFNEDEQTVLKILLTAPCVIDELSWKCNLPLSHLASILLSLEFRGMVKSLPGKMYKIQVG